MLSLLDYHKTTTNYFKNQQSVWDFFASHSHKEEQLVAFKTDLLKNTYQFDPESHGDIYEKVLLAKQQLNLSIPVTVYQAQHSDEINATIVYLNKEAHIVFSGKLLELLTAEELLGVIGHELSHVLLYTQLDGDAEISDRIVNAIANHQGSSPAHYETARLFKLYTEIFCDRGSYTVTNSYSPIISSLVKISTGLKSVNADSYIKQAEEIFAGDAATKTAGISHPENFIRARAIWLWHTKGSEAEAEICQMIEGYTNIEELDLFKQQKVAFITRQLIQLLLGQKWMQTPQTMALGKQYFGDLQLDNNPDKGSLAISTEYLHSTMKDYLAYVLYDFATNDKSLEDIPLGYCFFLSDTLHLDKAFLQAVKKEMKLSDKKAGLLKKKVLESFQEMEMQLRS